jgi:hypothetical protein
MTALRNLMKVGYEDFVSTQKPLNMMNFSGVNKQSQASISSLRRQ